MPANPNTDTNTTYKIDTGDDKGQIKVTPSSGDVYNVSVKGLGSAAYTESKDYATSGHTHTTSIATSTGTNQITLAFGKKYVITAGGSSYVFTMPANPNTDTNTTYTIATGDSNGQIKVTPSSGSAYNVSVKGLGSAAYTASTAYATSGHTHTTSIEEVGGNSQITLAYGNKYKITAGGTSYVFTMPPYTNDMVSQKLDIESDSGWRPILLGHELNSELSFKGCTNYSYINDKFAFNKNTACVKASGFVVDNSDSFLKANGSIDSNRYSTTSHTHDTTIATSTGTNQITLAFGTKYSISTGGTSYVFTMPSLPTATSSVAGIAKLGATGGSATYAHTHGSITNAGAITSNTTIASGDRLVITDNSDSSKIKRTSITFGTSTTTYLRNNGTWGTPSVSVSLPSSFFESDTPGVVIPIATTSNNVNFKDEPASYDTTPTLLFPTVSSDCMALPIFMDKNGHLFMLISDAFANDLVNRYGYSLNPKGK
jgi:predicted phosphodiesterase